MSSSPNSSSSSQSLWSLVGQQTAANRALDILELLERILYLLPPSQLLDIRRVSQHWNRAAHRPIWQYPAFLLSPKMEIILPQLEKYGLLVQELDFTQADATMWIRTNLQNTSGVSRESSQRTSEDALVVEALTKLCPNVRSLCLRYGCLRSKGLEALVQSFAAKKVYYSSHAFGYNKVGSFQGGEEGRGLELSQLHTLRLDLSREPWQAASMVVLTEILTEIGQGLRKLELKTNLRVEIQTNSYTPQRNSFLKFEPLLQHCGGYLQDLEIIPAPHFCDSDETTTEGFTALTGGVSGQATNLNTRILTHQTLKIFALRKPPLTRLHLGGVWFSEHDIWILAGACPMIVDLRLTNEELDGHPTSQELERIRNRDWKLHLLSEEEIRRSQRKKPLPLQLFLSLWGSRLKKLRLDGNKLCMKPSKTSEDYTASGTSIDTEGDAHGKSTSNANYMISQLAPSSGGSYRLSSLCLFHTVGLMDEQLITMVDFVEPTLQYINVDRSIHLTDKSIRYVLMTCSHLQELSAAELDLTMALFEDLDIYEEGRFIDQVKEGYGIAQKKWACADSLRILDLSWRSADGRAAHIPTTLRTGDYSQILSTWDRNLRPYHHQSIYQQQQQQRMERQNVGEQSIFDMDGEYQKFQKEEQAWQENGQRRAHGEGQWKPRLPLHLLQTNVLPMFRKSWHIESIYERLRVLEHLEVLQLEGWLIPWRAADITAFLGYGSEPEPSAEIDSHRLATVGQGMGAKGQRSLMSLPFNYVDADYLFIHSQERQMISKLYQPPVAPYGLETLKNIPISNLKKLRHLNIQCKQSMFLENPIRPLLGLGGSFYDSEDRFDLNTTTFAPALYSPDNFDSSSVHIHFNPRDSFSYKLAGDANTTDISTVNQMSDVQVLAYSVLGAFMKACPQLETFVIQPPASNTEIGTRGLRKPRESKIQLAKARRYSSMISAPLAITEYLANHLSETSDRKVLCTARTYSEYSVIRELER